MNRSKRYLVAASALRPNMHFEHAAAAFVKAIDFRPQQNAQQRVGYIAERSIADYQQTFKTLSKHFAGRRLETITPADFREYQELRASGAYTNQEPTAGAGPNANTINKELGVMLRLLKTARAWSSEMVESYIPLSPHESDAQRAMTPMEQEHFLKVAAGRERWAFVYWYSVFALATTMSTNELRNIRLKDINIDQQIVRVCSEGAKNKYRIRTIPLSDPALKAVRWLLERALQMGSTAPDHCLFPFRISKTESNPLRPMSRGGIRKQWSEVRKAADLKWLRPYDLRHTAITRLAEAGTAIQIIMDMAGHVSLKMQQHYTHISGQAKRAAVTLAELTQANAVNPKKSDKTRAALYSAMAAADSAIGKAADAGMITVSSLIKRLQRAGLGADTILAVLSDADEQKDTA